MYLPKKPRQEEDDEPAIDSSGDDSTPTAAAGHNSVNPLSSYAPKRRAEPWVLEETRALISLRKERDSQFNATKSNKHLWDDISMMLWDKGFDRSPAMCTDKWRNLLKEYKKFKQNNHDGYGSAIMNYYKEIEEILRDRDIKDLPTWMKSAAANIVAAAAGSSKVDSHMQLPDKGIDDADLALLEDNDDSFALNLERCLGHEGHPLSINAADAVGPSGVTWMEGPRNAQNSNTYGGRVINVKLGVHTRRIGIDGTAEAIKETIKCAFRLRTKRAFWLEDEDNIVRVLDRGMPLGNYTLHIDEGMMVKVCFSEQSEHMPVHTQRKTFYTNEDFRDFLSRCGWTCLREFNGIKNIDNLDDLCPGAVYCGVNELAP